MSKQTSIEWTDWSWNPATGCTKVGPGCDRCYAQGIAERFRGTPAFPNGFDVTLHPDRLGDPLRWRKPRRVFVNSMSDLFHENIHDAFIGQTFDTMEAATWHTYQVLTKRAPRMRDFAARRYGQAGAPAHIWLGVSVEGREQVGRIKHLRSTPAATRFVSFEPLLGQVGEVDLCGIAWVIVGGESGPRARRMELAWVRHILDQAGAQGAAPFVKQLGTAWGKAHKDISTFPPELQVRDWPRELP